MSELSNFNDCAITVCYNYKLIARIIQVSLIDIFVNYK